MPSLCIDCGIDTTPYTGLRGWRSGKHTSKYAYRYSADRWEHYMVTDGVWKSAGMPASTVKMQGEPDGNFLCIGCLKLRIGRRLTALDFTDCLLNRLNSNVTRRLRDRLSSG